MKIDKEKLKALASLSDEALWRTIVSVAAEHGIKAPDVPPSSSDMTKIRGALESADKQSLYGALKIINRYRKEKH